MSTNKLWKMVTRHPDTEGSFTHHFATFACLIDFMIGLPDGTQLVSVERIIETKEDFTDVFIKEYNTKVRHDPQI